MRPRETRIPIERGRAAVRYGLYALVLCSPLPFGSVQPWAVMVLELWAACLGVGALWIIYHDPESLSARARWLLVPAGLLMCIGLLQLVPLPHTTARILSGPAEQARLSVIRVLPEASSDLVPISIAPPDTTDALLRLAACVLVGLAAAVSLRERRHLKQATMAIIASGAFQALYGSAEYLSGHQHIFGYAKIHYLQSATGTFINRNHFAGYLAMTLPFAVGAVLEGAARRAEGNWRARFLRSLEPPGIKRILAGIAALLILAGILLSYSRGGLAAALVGAVVLALGACRNRRTLAMLLMLFLLPALVLSWQEVKAPGERFFTHSSEILSLNNRLPVWRASARMLLSQGPIGGGLGTFEPAFRLHQPAAVEKRWTHAHNDWLEVVLEGGIGAGLLVLAILYGAVSRKVTPSSRDVPDLFRLCLRASLAAIAFHSLLDFQLRIPATAVLLGCCVGASVLSSVKPNTLAIPGGKKSRRADASISPGNPASRGTAFRT